MGNYELSFFPLLCFFVLKQEMIYIWLREAKENISTINFKDKKEGKIGYQRVLTFWQQLIIEMQIQRL